MGMENEKSIDDIIREFNEKIEEETDDDVETEPIETADAEDAPSEESSEEDENEEASDAAEGDAESESTPDAPDAPNAPDETETDSDESAPSEITDAQGAPTNDEESKPPEDFSALIEKDFEEYKKLYPDTKAQSFVEIPNFRHFARYRGMGLSVEEAAYLSSRGADRERQMKEMEADATATHAASKAHLRSAAPSKPTGGSDARISRSTLEWARETYPGMTDKEIQELYRRASQ